MSSSGGRLASLAFTSLGHFANDGMTFSVGLIADLFTAEKIAAPPAITLMFVVFYASPLILSLYVGRKADASGRPGRLISLGVALLALGMVGFYSSIELVPKSLVEPTILVSALLAGFGSAFYHPLGATILQSTFGQASKGKAMGVNGAMGSLGRTIYPTLFFVFAALSSNGDAPLFFGLIGLVLALAIYVGLRGFQSPVTARKQSADATPQRSLSIGVIVLSVVAFVRSATLGGMTSWLPTYLTYGKGYGFTGKVGIAISLIYAVAILGQPFFGWLVDKFDKRYVLGLSTFFAGLSMLASVSLSGIVTTVFLAAFAFCAFSGFPLLLSLASDYAQGGHSSLSNAMVWGLGSGGGGTLGPAIVGYLIGFGQYGLLGHAFLTMSFVAIVVSAASIFMPKPLSYRKLPAFS